MRTPARFILARTESEMHNPQDWRPSAAYIYTLHLDGPGLAWEYLRRHPNYQRDWQQNEAASAVAQRWGLHALEDPRLDARSAQPLWTIDPDNLVRLTADHSGSAGLFTLWDIPGHKRLIHDGHRLLLTRTIGHQQLRYALDSSVQEGQPVAYLLSAGDRTAAHWQAIAGQNQIIAAARARKLMPPPRPDRTALLHMRGLQALDGVLAGASHRTIATVLFGPAATRHWDNDGDVRNQIRYLIRRSRGFLNGGYRRLLSRFTRSRQGKTTLPTDSP